MIVYLARNLANGKGYVGKTTRSLVQRWKEHVRNAVAKHDTMPLYAAIRKHGAQTFEVNVLQECGSLEELNAAEVRWIANLRTFGEGYNATPGGDGLYKGYKHTAATRAKMSANRSGKKLGPATEEHRRHISEGRMGKGTGPRSHVRGWHHGDEARVRIGLATSIRKRKPVLQVTEEGTILEMYPSLQAAALAVGGQANKISEVLCGHRRTHKGYLWQYAPEGGKAPADRVEV